MHFSILSAEIWNVFISQSANTGIAPQRTTGIEVDDIVNGGTITSSPTPTSQDSNAT